MKEEDIDRIFRDAAEKQDFLFSTGAWERMESQIPSAENPDAAFAAASERFSTAPYEPSERGFEAVLALKRRLSTRILLWKISRYAALIALLISGAGYLSLQQPTSDLPAQPAHEATAKSPEQLKEQAEQPAVAQEVLPEKSAEPTNAINSGSTPSTRSLLADAIVGEAPISSRPVHNPLDVTHRAVSWTFADSDWMMADALPNHSVGQADTLLDNPTVAGTDENSMEREGNPRFSKRPKLPQTKWSLLAGGRSMRLTDVPEGFDISKYSPEIGVSYQIYDRKDWTLEAEVSAYWVAGTLGKVTFARKIAGFGDATEYRHISADQVMQLEFPIRFSWKLSPHQSWFVGLNQTYMLPAAVRVEEETVDWYGVAARSEKVETGYIYGLRRYNVALNTGFSRNLLPKMAVQAGLSYYFLDRDLLDAEALAPIPWQLQFGIRYRI